MLQLNNASASITESGYASQTGTYTGDIQNTLTNCVQWQWQPYTYWQSYPVYICTDKTKKAIDILKLLESDKTVKVASVKRFIELVEKIAGLL